MRAATRRGRMREGAPASAVKATAAPAKPVPNVQNASTQPDWPVRRCTAQATAMIAERAMPAATMLDIWIADIASQSSERSLAHGTLYGVYQLVRSEPVPLRAGRVTDVQTVAACVRSALATQACRSWRPDKCIPRPLPRQVRVRRSDPLRRNHPVRSGHAHG